MIIYIAGAMRSGSTLLGRLLGSIPGAFYAGELHNLWYELAVDGRCSCRSPIRSCPFWSGVLHAMAPELSAVGWGVAEARLWRERTLSLRRLRLLPSGPFSQGSRARGRAKYSRLARAVYQAVASLTGARVVIDSSKVPAGALLLESMEGIDARVLHIVRDPRATAQSWAVHKGREFHDGRSRWLQELPSRSAWQATASWTAYNAVLSGVVAHRSLPYRLVRYEDLTDAPLATMAGLASWCDLDPAGLRMDEDGTAHLAPGHSASGNMDRFADGAVPIEDRNDWRLHTGRPRAAAISLATAPLRRRYSYPSLR